MDRMFESLEGRRLFAVLSIVGTNGPDIINVKVVGSQVVATVNGVATSYSGVTGILIQSGPSADDVRVDNNVYVNATLAGNNGDDFIAGGSGNDQINGGDGNDEVYGRDGNDTLNGNGGDDILLNGGDGADYCYGGTGGDKITGGQADETRDYLYGNSASVASSPSDVLYLENYDVGF